VLRLIRVAKEDGPQVGVRAVIGDACNLLLVFPELDVVPIDMVPERTLEQRAVRLSGEKRLEEPRWVALPFLRDACDKGGGLADVVADVEQHDNVSIHIVAAVLPQHRETADV
jgi:hypothetical protein